MSQDALLFARGIRRQPVVCFTESLDLLSWLHQSKPACYVAEKVTLSCPNRSPLVLGNRDVQTPVLERVQVRCLALYLYFSLLGPFQLVLIVRIEACKVAENEFNRRTRDKGKTINYCQ